MFAENFNTAEGYGLYGGFNSVFVCDNGISVAKQVNFPNGWTDDTNLSFKVLFKNGHNCADASTPMTLNGVAVVVNKYGTLIPLPIHEMDDGGTPIYKSLQPNTILEMYYTDNYDGADTPAYVIIGNPIVLSSADYTIYADGQMGVDISHPIGSLYTQYPMQLSPLDLFKFTTWEVINYGGAFFRSNGGNAETFEKSLTISLQNGVNITFSTTHNLTVGTPIYDYENNECRFVATIEDTSSITIDSAFSHSNLTSVLIGQNDTLQNHVHSQVVKAGNYDVSGGYPYYGGSSKTSEVGNTTPPKAYNDFGEPRVSNETRSINFTYKVWRRTN